MQPDIRKQLFITSSGLGHLREWVAACSSFFRGQGGWYFGGMQKPGAEKIDNHLPLTRGSLPVKIIAPFHYTISA